MVKNFLKECGKIVVFFLFIIFLIPNLSFANTQCYKNGYTVLTLNGVLTNKSGAIENRDRLKDHLPNNYKNEPVNIDFLLNPSHIAGLLDFTDALAQGFFNVSSDYDLTEMLVDASNKITTQKVLLVGHSQGNFYANNLYKKVADIDGGIPKDSIRVYAIGTPANNVAGKNVVSQQDYITSDTDKAIAGVTGTVFSILPANVHIDLQKGDDYWGHDFAKVYLKYQADKIVSDIVVSLDKLKTNNVQNENELCVNPPAITIAHKIQGLVFAVADPVAGFTKTVAVGTVTGAYNVGLAISNTTAKVGSSIGSSIHYLASLISNDGKNLTANIGGLNVGGDVINALDDSANTAQNTDLNTNKDTTEATPPSDVRDSMVVELPGGTTPPNTQVRPVYSGAVADATEQNNSSATTHATLTTTETNLASANPQNLYKDLLLGSGGGGGGSGGEIAGNEAGSDGSSGTDPLVCITPKILNATGDACVDPAPVCGAPQTLVNNVCVDPPSPPAPALVTTTIDKDTTLLAGEYNYENLVITNNAILTLAGDPTSANPFKGVKITATNITIDSGSSISADGKGYGSNKGPGASLADDVGASYGGLSYNGATHSTTYGSEIKPTDLGSGGVYFSYGGGAIRIIVSDTFIDNGTVSSDGGISSSGGSVYVTAKNMAGNGTLRANGGGLFAGNTFTSPGGGGRIAVYYQTSSFAGTAGARGGCGHYSYPEIACGEDGTVGFFDTTNNDLYLNSSWKFLQADTPFNFNNIFISNGVQVASENNVNITANNILMDGASIFTLSGDEIINANTLLVTGNSVITVLPEKILYLKIPNITINLGSMILADAKGYISGPGTPATFYEAGASYGGIGGGATAKPSYGSAVAPVDFGSGTESHRGGGAIRLIVDNNLQNDGIISANGNLYQRVSGGSIYVTANKINGNGSFQVMGGNSEWPYGYTGGGGGRIAIYYQESSFGGTAIARAGEYCYSGCNPAGGNGTVKMINTTIPLDSSKVINAFNFSSLVPAVTGTVDESNHTISLTVPFNTDVTTLVPAITISDKASISPNNNLAQNFSSSVTYTITAEDNSTQNYVVTVTVAPDPNPPADTTSPVLVSAKVTSANMIEVTFSKDINGTTVNTTGNEFTVTGHTVSSAHKLTGGIIILTLSTTMGVGETPSITFSSTNFKDLAGNQAVSPATVIATNNI